MKFQPLITLLVVLPYLVAALAVSGWKIWQVRHKGRPVLLLWLRRSALLLLPALVALGPSVRGGTSAPGVANLDVVIAVDTTPSMGAVDYAGTQQRLDGARKDSQALATKLSGAHIEIITFDSSATISVPFTNDNTAIAAVITDTGTEVSGYSQGSAIDKPVDLITKELKIRKTAYPEHKRLLFYLGDGEQTAQAAIGSFAPVAPYLNGGGVLSYGTAKGASIINNTGIPSTSAMKTYIQTIDLKTKKLVMATSKTDPKNLKTIAGQLKVSYVDRNKGGSIDPVYKASQAPLIIDHSQHVVRYLNLYWLLAIPFVILLFWEWQKTVAHLLALHVPRKGHHE